MTETTQEQIEDSYRQMAERARYRPMAPSDGLGGITVPLEELDLDEEAREYAQEWWKEEDTGDYSIGTCDFRTRPATIYAIEAARNLTGVSNSIALELLRMAVEELEKLGVEGRS